MSYMRVTNGLKAVSQYVADHSCDSITFPGDFNGHNLEWIPSSSKCDAAGLAAQEFSECFGFTHLVDFSTREGNALEQMMEWRI